MKLFNAYGRGFTQIQRCAPIKTHPLKQSQFNMETHPSYINTLLEGQYGSKSQNTHIEYFYVIFEQPLNVIPRPFMDDIIKRTLGPENWTRVGPGWGNLLLLIKYDIQCNSEHEREVHAFS